MSDNTSHGYIITLWIIAATIAIYLITWAIAYWILAPRMTFRPPPPIPTIPENTLMLSHNHGEKIAAKWFNRSSDSNGIILYQHGNAEQLDELGTRLYTLAKISDKAVFAYEYRGYGHSDGIATLKNMPQDGELAWQYLIQEGYHAKNIIIYGRSLGTHNATILAQAHQPAALILEVPMWDAFRIYADYFWVPCGVLENGKLIVDIEAPTLILYTKDDELINPWHSHYLYEASPARLKERVMFQCAHGKIPEQAEYPHILQQFLTRLQSA